MRGGYRILDLKGRNFTNGSGQTIKGSFETLEGSTKATLVEGLVIGGKEYKSACYDFIFDGEKYSAKLGSVSIDVAQDDTVTPFAT